MLWGIYNLYLNIVSKGLLSVLSRDLCALPVAHSRVTKNPIYVIYSCKTWTWGSFTPYHLCVPVWLFSIINGPCNHLSVLVRIGPWFLMLCSVSLKYLMHPISRIWPFLNVFMCFCWEWHFMSLRHRLCDFNCCVAQLPIPVSVSGWRHSICDFYHHIYVINSNSIYGLSLWSKHRVLIRFRQVRP